MTLVFDNVSHSFGDQSVLSEVSLEAHPGEILCLLGASGCGKTTLLRLAAGLETLQGGSISLDGTTMADARRSIPAEDRHVGMLFQDHALFPHLSVADNIRFGMHGLDDLEQRDRLQRGLQDVGLSGFEDRFPHTLSGGQQQRVALARALAPAPAVVLLDEPFASVDVSRRRRLREQARLALKRSGAVVILVTHDPDEALDVSDRIAVMEAGRIAQCADPATLYHQPASALVAGLFGEAQTLEGVVDGETVQTAFGPVPVGGMASETEVDAIVRPQAVSLGKALGDEATGLEVADIRFRGDHRLALIRSQEDPTTHLHVRLNGETGFEVGEAVSVSFDADGVFIFARD